HVVRRSVEPDPDDRYATAAELAVALNSSKSARPRRNRAVIVAAAALAVAGGLTAALLGGFGRSAASAPDPQVIVVLPFRVTGTDTTLGSGVAELLATEFTGEGAPRAVDPAAVWRSWRASQHSTKEGAMRLAASLGAGRVLSGSMVGSGSRLTLSAVIYAVPDGREVARPDPVSGPADSLPLLVRRVTASLLTGAPSGDPDAPQPRNSSWRRSAVRRTIRTISSCGRSWRTSTSTAVCNSVFQTHRSGLARRSAEPSRSIRRSAPPCFTCLISPPRAATPRRRGVGERGISRPHPAPSLRSAYVGVWRRCRATAQRSNGSSRRSSAVRYGWLGSS